jgi:hypothetical protein
VAILKIISEKNIAVVRFLLIFISIIISCSNFNQPISPILFFTDWSEDQKSGSYVFFRIDRFAGIFVNWDIESDYFPMNVKIFIKKRNENEYITEPLSSQSFTGCIVVHLSRSNQVRGNLYADFIITGSNGKSLDFGTTWPYEDNRIYFDLDSLPIASFSPFFWQAEFYLRGDTLRIPEQPGISYFIR